MVYGSIRCIPSSNQICDDSAKAASGPKKSCTCLLLCHDPLVCVELSVGGCDHQGDKPTRFEFSRYAVQVSELDWSSLWKWRVCGLRSFPNSGRNLILYGVLRDLCLTTCLWYSDFRRHLNDLRPWTGILTRQSSINWDYWAMNSV